MGTKYTVFFLILVFDMSFSIIFIYILEGLFQVFWYCTTTPGPYWSGRKTPTGPVAGHYKNPILPFGLGLKAFFFSSDCKLYVQIKPLIVSKSSVA